MNLVESERLKEGDLSTCPSGLAYCRHLSTVRTHLSALVNHNIVPPDRPCEASGGLSKEVWSKYQKDCKVGEREVSSGARTPSQPQARAEIRATRRLIDQSPLRQLTRYSTFLQLVIKRITFSNRVVKLKLLIRS